LKFQPVTPDSKLGRLLAAIFDDFRSHKSKSYRRRQLDFIFHMTDWSDDLERLAELFKHPNKYDRETAGLFICGFLYHVIPHLNAAGRLLLDEIPDAFKETANQP
jgi:hypothetical protein